MHSHPNDPDDRQAERPEDLSGPAAVLVVGLPSDDEQVTRIVTILRQLEIPAAVTRSGVSGAGTGRVALRVPAERVVAAVLALEQHGFTRVTAYGS